MIVSNKRILICDEAGFCSLPLKEQLNDAHYSVDIEYDTLSIIEHIKTLHYDFIFIATTYSKTELIQVFKTISRSNSLLNTVCLIDKGALNTLGCFLDHGISNMLDLETLEETLVSFLERGFTTLSVLSSSKSREKLLEEYKNAIDESFVVSKHNKEGNIIFVNRAFCTLFNIDGDDVAIKGLNPLLHEDTNGEKVLSKLKEVEGVYKERHHFTYLRKEYVLDLVVTPIADESEDISEYIVFISDRSKLVELGRALQEQKKKENLRELMIKKEQAEEVNRLKDSLLNIFVHELKTPLNSIINFSAYINKQLKKSDLSKKSSLMDKTSEIHKSGLIMLEIIENIMYATKLKSNLIEYNIQTHDIKDIVEQVISGYKPEIEKINLCNEMQGQCTVLLDNVRFEHLFSNIVSNAIKYGKGKVGICLETNDDNTYFMLSVHDNGNGFVSTENVFELFEQGEEDFLRRESVGAGVGLFIVKQLCDAMQLHVELGSSLELGGAKVIISGKIKVDE